MKKEILEEVEELQQILGVLHTRLNNLVNKKELVNETNPVEMECLTIANKYLAGAWENLEYAINEEY